MATEHINYYLKKNPLKTSDENEYIAEVKKKPPVYQEQLVAAMVGKNTTVTRQDIIVVLDLLKETVLDKTLDGYPVHTCLFRTGLSIRGGFNSDDDRFDRKRHRICLNMNPAIEIGKIVSGEGNPRKTEQTHPSMEIYGVTNLEDPSRGSNLFAGGLAEIKGTQFTSDPAVKYIFLRKDGFSEEIPVKKIHRINIRRILCYMPDDLEPGNYHLILYCSNDKKVLRRPFCETVAIVKEEGDM